MTPILVNGDYEEWLAGRGPRARLNGAIECLAFWVQSAPVLVHRSYPDFYLEHVAHHTGHRPEIITKSTNSIPWWGEALDHQLESKLNAKTWAFTWWKERWPLEGAICRSAEEVEKIIGDGRRWLIKRDHGMSGRGHLVVSKENWAELKKRVEDWLPEAMVVEPLRERDGDVAALWMPERNQFVFHRNEVDARFQWRATLLGPLDMPDPRWPERLEELAREIRGSGYASVFGIDAFTYQEKNQRKLHPCSEINARKSMGWVAHRLWEKCPAAHATLLMESAKLGEAAWKKLVSDVASHVLVLSPPDNPFVWAFVTGMDETEVVGRRERFKMLVADRLNG